MKRSLHYLISRLALNNLNSLNRHFVKKTRYQEAKGNYSLAAFIKLLWYWYVMRGAGSILET